MSEISDVCGRKYWRSKWKKTKFWYSYKGMHCSSCVFFCISMAHLQAESQNIWSKTWIQHLKFWCWYSGALSVFNFCFFCDFGQKLNDHHSSFQHLPSPSHKKVLFHFPNIQFVDRLFNKKEKCPSLHFLKKGASALKKKKRYRLFFFWSLCF